MRASLEQRAPNVGPAFEGAYLTRTSVAFMCALKLHEELCTQERSSRGDSSALLYGGSADIRLIRGGLQRPTLYLHCAQARIVYLYGRGMVGVVATQTL